MRLFFFVEFDVGPLLNMILQFFLVGIHHFKHECYYVHRHRKNDDGYGLEDELDEAINTLHAENAEEAAKNARERIEEEQEYGDRPWGKKDGH